MEKSKWEKMVDEENAKSAIKELSVDRLQELFDKEWDNMPWFVRWSNKKSFGRLCFMMGASSGIGQILKVAEEHKEKNG